MRLLFIATALAWSPGIAAQTTADEPVRVSIAHLCAGGDEAALPALAPAAGGEPMLALGPHRPDGFDDRLLDLVANRASMHFGRDRRPQITRDGTDLVASGGKVGREEMRRIMLDCVETFAPIVSLEVAVHRAGPAVLPAVLAPGERERSLAGRALYSRRVDRAAGHATAIDLAGKDGERLRLRVEAEPLDASEHVALLCEFTLERRARDGARWWTAGTASGVVARDAVLALSFPDRVVTVSASSPVRAATDLAGVSWSLLTTTALRGDPDLGEGARLLCVEAEWPLAEPDRLLARIRDRVPAPWDQRGGIYADQTRNGRMLIGGSPEPFAKALPAVRATIADFAAPWCETACLECELPVEAHATVPAIIHLPALPGRLACVLHAVLPAGEAPARGALVALQWIGEDGAEDAAGLAPGLERLAGATGVAVRLGGRDATERAGKPVRFHDARLDADGITSLAATSDLRVELRRGH